jgi:DNA topoisomerase-1
MEGIVKREYVKISGKYLDATQRGEYVVDTLVGRCQFMDIPYTKSVEGQLDEVAAGKIKYEDVVRGMYDQLKKELSGVNAKVVAGLNSGPPPEVSAEFMCADPSCNKPLCRRQSKSGKGFWWGCTGFKDGCKNIYYDKDGKPDYEAAKHSQESGRSGSQRRDGGSGNSRGGKSSSRSSGKGSTRGAEAYRAVTSRSGGRGR